MYEPSWAIDIPSDQKEQLYSTLGVTNEVSFLQKLRREGYITRRFLYLDILRDILSMTEEELFEETIRSNLKTDLSRGGAVIQLYNSRVWLLQPSCVNIQTQDTHSVYKEELRANSPLATMIGDQSIFRSGLSTKNFNALLGESLVRVEKSIQREKIDILNPPEVVDLPLLPNKTSKTYLQDFDEYTRDVVKYNDFLQWSAKVSSYEREKVEYLENMFDTVIRKDQASRISGVNDLRFYLINNVSNKDSVKLRFVVDTQVSKKEGCSVITMDRLVVKDCPYKDRRIILVNTNPPKYNLTQFLSMFESGKYDKDFLSDLLYYISYNFMKEGGYSKLKLRDYPNFIETR